MSTSTLPRDWLKGVNFLHRLVESFNKRPEVDLALTYAHGAGLRADAFMSCRMLVRSGTAEFGIFSPNPAG